MAGSQAGINVKAHPDRHVGRIARLRQALAALPADAKAKRAELQASIVHHEGALKQMVADANAALAQAEVPSP